MMLQRSISDICLELLDNFPAIGLIGPRQVGKTTLAKKLTNANNKVIYLDLELPQDLAALNNPELFLTNNQQALIIIDEIQRKPELYPILRAVIDQDRRPGRFILLGSASPELIRDSSESLAGRIVYQELTPFSLSEVDQDYQTHWFRGGYPNAFLAKNDKMWYFWMQSFIGTYVDRDIPALGLRVAPSVLSKFITMLSHYHGNVWNASEIGNAMGLSSVTIGKYVHFLQEAFLIRLLPPYFANTKKRLIKSPKIYIRDAGMRHALIGIKSFTELEFHPTISASWEGYVIEQIYQEVRADFELSYYRTKSGAEADVVLLKAGQPFAVIEITYGSAPKLSKGLQSVIQDLQCNHNYIITPNSKNFEMDLGVQVWGLKAFIDQVIPKLLMG